MEQELLRKPKMDSKAVIDHLWKYFEIHSQQRMTLFNFYIVICGVISSVIGYGIQSTKDLISLEITLCILLTSFSFLFYKLDQRTSFLIKRSEKALVNFENQFNTTGINLFVNDSDDPCCQIRITKLGRFWLRSMTIIVKPHLSWRFIA